MKQYTEARQRTKARIEEAYWELMLKNERITVQKIADRAGIHKSTFYFYYEWVGDVLDGIKSRLMRLLVEVLEGEARKSNDFRQVMRDMRAMFSENRKYLVPLVIEQRGERFALEYRAYLKERFARDIGLDFKTGNDVKNDVANCVLTGLVEMMLYELSSEIMPDEFTYMIGNGIINKGVRETMIRDFNIKFGNEAF